MPDHSSPTPMAVLDAALDQIETVTPHLLASRALQRRLDFKHLLDLRQVEQLVQHLQSTHAVIRTAGRSRARYSTRYLDTPDLQTFHDHRRGKPRRLKLRFRDYLDRELTVLELKQRTGRGEARKQRLQRSYLHHKLDDQAREFLANTSLADARPSVSNSFERVTLVGRNTPERLTIDLGLRLEHDGRVLRLRRACIVEVKATHRRDALALAWLLRAGLRPLSISKYCLGIILLHDQPRHHQALTLRRIERLEGHSLEAAR